jgi:GAF domain-containing protein
VSLSEPGQNPPAAPGGRDLSQRRLLQSVVEVARTVFGAAASSVFLLDPDSGELVFEAVCGEGEDHLVGTRLPGDTGIAGWVVSSGQPMLVDDVRQSAQFAAGAAESTGYVPRSIMAAPLISDGECVGVLEVLDRGSRHGGELGDVDLLGVLAAGLGMAVGLLPPAGTGSGNSPLDEPLLRRLAERLPSASESVATTVTGLLAMADNLLAGGDPAASAVRA